MSILHMNFRSEALQKSVYPLIFLPDLNGWNDQEPPYRSLIFLHGYTGGNLETATFVNLFLFSMVYGIAIVMPNGDNSFYADHPSDDRLYSRYVGEELPEMVRKALPISRRREDTWIGGISMGGYGALINGLRYPETFSKIAVLSPALRFYRAPEAGQPDFPCPRPVLEETLGTWPEFRDSYRDLDSVLVKAAREGRPLPEIFAACGKQDELLRDIFPAWCREMKEQGVPLTSWTADGQHDHDFWKRAMDPLCRFLTGREE